MNSNLLSSPLPQSGSSSKFFCQISTRFQGTKYHWYPSNRLFSKHYQSSHANRFYCSRSPASTHRLSRKQLRLQTRKVNPLIALQALYATFMKRVQWRISRIGTDNDLDLDDPA